MNRRDFLAGSLGTMAAAASSESVLLHSGEAGAAAQTLQPASDPIPGDPRQVRFRVKPVLTSIVHTHMWEGPCRWEGMSPERERAGADSRFAAWSKEIAGMKLGDPHTAFLAPAHLIHSEDFVLHPEELAKLKPDSQETDAYYVEPDASSISALQIAEHFRKPILFKGLSARGADIAPYANAKGREAFVPADDEEFRQLVSALRARKVFRSTKVLFPTERGYPAALCLSGSPDVEDLEKRLGVVVRKISYKELADEMNHVLGDRAAAEEADRAARDLLQKADKAYLGLNYVTRSFQFYRVVRRLMARHGCNAFTIECFEFCASRLPQKWLITPCLIHALLRNQDCAASCEADMGSLLAMRMLMTVSQRSCHQGNWYQRDADSFLINHSAPSMKMNGYDQPDLPYQLGRFVTQGWGTKVIIDFMNNREKTVTVARVDPTSTKVLVIRGELVGASGWGKDLIGCSVEAVIRPPKGRLEECLRKRIEYGNHQQWVYGDWTRQMRQLAEVLGLKAHVIS